jgi:hypothetical protein
MWLMISKNVGKPTISNRHYPTFYDRHLHPFPVKRNMKRFESNKTTERFKKRVLNRSIVFIWTGMPMAKFFGYILII